MTHPLDGPRLKVRRAEQQIDFLRNVQETYRGESEHQVIRAEFNPEIGEYTYRAQIGRQPGPEWGILAGEIAHNLRSSLDGLVFQLAALNVGETPTWRSQFPIFLHRLGDGRRLHGFEGHRNRKGRIVIDYGSGRAMIRDLRPCHQAMIERLQPYKRGRGGKRCLLALLTEINNTDKHRIILPGIAHSVGYSFGAWVLDDSDGINDTAFPAVRFRILKDGAKLFSAPKQMQVNPKIIVSVAFGNECASVYGKGIVNTFRAISKEVSEIVEGFAPEFS